MWPGWEADGERKLQAQTATTELGASETRAWAPAASHDRRPRSGDPRRGRAARRRGHPDRDHRCPAPSRGGLRPADPRLWRGGRRLRRADAEQAACQRARPRPGGGPGHRPDHPGNARGRPHDGHRGQRGPLPLGLAVLVLVSRSPTRPAPARPDRRGRRDPADRPASDLRGRSHPLARPGRDAAGNRAADGLDPPVAGARAGGDRPPGGRRRANADRARPARRSGSRRHGRLAPGRHRHSRHRRRRRRRGGSGGAGGDQANLSDRSRGHAQAARAAPPDRLRPSGA